VINLHAVAPPPRACGRGGRALWGYLQAPPSGIRRRGGIAQIPPRRRPLPDSMSSQNVAALEERFRLLRLRPVERAYPYLRPVGRTFQSQAVSLIFIASLVGYHKIPRVYFVMNNQAEHESQRRVERLYVRHSSSGTFVLNVPQGSGAQANTIGCPTQRFNNGHRKHANTEWD
jgi:hypothetical protein